MKESTSSSVLRLGDVVIALVLLTLFIMGYVYAQDWPFRAAFFPQLLSVAGIAFGVLKLIGFGIQAYRGRRATAQASGGNLVASNVDVDGKKAVDESLEYVFGTAGGRAWAAAVAWVAAFFFSLWLFGVFITVPLFAFAYLRAAGGAGWLGSAAYAVALGGVLWLVFRQMLSVPMPTGIF